MTYIAGEYDIIVVGAGHAGCESALAGARLGKKTLLVTMNLDSIALMPCNPNIGGTGKGHLVRELDALGGEMGKNIDKSMIQCKMLNTAKGPAVHSLRAQADKLQYQKEMKQTLEKQENLHLKQYEVTELLVENGKATGVVVKTGAVFQAKAVILATGTYLKARIVIGDTSYDGGPNGLFGANELSGSLRELGVRLLRFKTGTPARVDKRSVDFSKMTIQEGDPQIVPFSFETEKIDIDQLPCYLTYTNEKTHQVIRDNLHRSPLFSGDIEGVGPRYCPSIEDKVVRFSDKPKHQIFIEPEGRDTYEMYVQGMSSSLPEEVQLKMLRTVEGMENVEIMRLAYAIEYDNIDPVQLKPSLEFKSVDHLFFAGQINGTSGYEEAAAQGLIAGINAVKKLEGTVPLILDRSQAYIGVLIDDIVTKGTLEPYRMMTSRAEYRLILRQDNADLRLTKIGYDIGLIGEERYQKFQIKERAVQDEIERVKKVMVKPTKELEAFFAGKNSTFSKKGFTLYELLKRPEMGYFELEKFDPDRPKLPINVIEQVEIQIKYEGYIKKQWSQVEQFKKLERRKIPENLDYEKISGLRTEARQKLSKIRPISVGHASRISGVSPADISVLLVHMENFRRREKTDE
ncbi:tRNA uridine-5-carboxymethylaminomethyl(34) synthesis enzyme MnmG [Alkalibacter rhizosphaerae]|uniref:tRNA uridine 5-carboxymethylaminomethyl modification enzyme MnmG n=1 Tax=Alkalibacter rhizosphaerae TaxID=2815577 RepID=A0A974XF47_9FIRM|nr:tRNA uridine-5-carboxymethylaminomethyl(34) synthesis enzyme MnmG [Alkalibacter rhizosphaerae]QSX07575.1 tRNA uridine-5-carboxymethylaminomethyl(34) synthesis enzyme MnmG [Alkalibacter rhizosphaerae]